MGANKSELACNAAERRGLRRQRVLLSGVISEANGENAKDCVIRDLNRHGAQVECSKQFPVGAQLYLLDTHNGAAYIATVMWTDSIRTGLAFVRSYAMRSPLPAELAFLERLLLEAKLRQVSGLIGRGIPIKQAITTVGLTEDQLEEMAERAGCDEKFELVIRQAKRLLSQ
jgi:hypothetical protein